MVGYVFWIHEVAGSSPVFPTINGEISVKANTAVCESANTEFESRILPKWECANDGELGRTVNPLLYGLVGSNPTIPTIIFQYSKVKEDRSLTSRLYVLILLQRLL